MPGVTGAVRSGGKSSGLMKKMIQILGVSARFAVFLMLLMPSTLLAGSLERALSPLLGPDDALLATDANGHVLVSLNAERKLVPASILKVLTALVALRHLGPEYRFSTGFYLDSGRNLKIRGSGDPLLLSETVQTISALISQRLSGNKALSGIILDDTYFEKPLGVPGVRSLSDQPYDAPNGALCVNFNTVNFKRENGRFVTGEPQTPLLPSVMPRIRKSGHSEERILLSGRGDACTRYAGELFRHFLKKEGVSFTKGIRTGLVSEARDLPLYLHEGGPPLTAVIEKMLRYSNNFMANQLLLAAGARAFGAPATLEKGVLAARDYAAKELGSNGITLAEGSGISRENRVSAAVMMKIVERFKPFRHLMRRKGNERYKTGTLFGISTRAGYIETKDRGLVSFVVMTNTPGKRAARVSRKLMASLDAGGD